MELPVPPTEAFHSTGCVRTAVSADLPFIQEWLKREERDGRGFIHNWHLIQKAFAEKEMMVFAGPEGVIGFLTYGISVTTILQTKSDCQRRGVGRALVEDAIQKEQALNNAVIVVQCEPHSSVEFWSKMGFEAHRGGVDFKHQDLIYMQRQSTLVHLEIHGNDLEMVTVCVYPEHVLYSKEPERVKPDRVHYVMARLDEETRRLKLARRITVARESMLRDPVVEISWGGMDILKGKLKHPAASAVGFRATPNNCGWYLDAITLPNFNE